MSLLVAAARSRGGSGLRSLLAGGPFTALAIASGFLVIGLILYPLANLVIGLFVVDGRFTFEAIEQTLAEPDLGQILLNTLIYVVVSGAFGLFIGALLAWLAERTDASLGWATGIVPLVPIFLPSLAGTIGWVLLCAPRAGLVNIGLRALVRSDAETGPIDIFSLPGMIVVTAIHLVPFAYLAVSAALRNLDASMEEASRMSGAGLLRTLRRVSLPIVTPALYSGAVLILMSALTLFTIPAILGGNAKFTVFSVLIYRLIAAVYPPRMGEAVVLSVLALLLIQILIASQLALTARRFQTIGAQGLRQTRIRLGVLKPVGRVLIALYLLGAAILPLIALGFVGFERFWTPDLTPERFTLQNYQAVFSLDANVQFVAALRNSLGLSLGVAIIDITAATMLAYYLSRRPGWLARVLDVIASFPSTVPHIVMGVAFLLAFSRPPLVLYGTVGLIFLAYLAIYMPQAMQSSKFTFGQINPELGEASRVFGASEARTFLRILLPLVLPSAISGGIIVAVLTINETNASVLLATVDSVVVGPTLYRTWAAGNVPPVAAFATIVCLMDAGLALASLAIARRLSIQRT